MKSIPDSLTPEEAWRRLASCPRLTSEVKETADALGYRLEVAVHIPQDVPAADRSFMDGFAVRSQDATSVPCTLRIVGEVLMGVQPTRALSANEAMFIPTGGFLPQGADAVVMQEDTEVHEDTVRIHKSVAANENVQRQGEDFQKQDLLFPAMHCLRAQDLSALATFGITEAPVIQRPAVAIISTGNELVNFHEQPGPAEIRETNSLALSTAARQQGFTIHSLGIIRDDPDAQRSSLAKALTLAQVVLFSGGSSVGERDYTLDVIRSFEKHRIHFHGLAIRPGNPTIFASVGSRWVFGLPGQPVSSLVVFYQFVLPFLFHLSGENIDYARFAETHFRNVSATLEESIKPLNAKTDYVRLRLRRSGQSWLARPVPGKSASLSTLAKADGFAIVPPGQELIEKGTSLTAFFFP